MSEEDLTKYPDIGNSDGKYKEVAQHCYECIKTKHFWVSIIIIGALSTLFAALIFEEYFPDNIVMSSIFVLFWGGIVGGILIGTAILSGMSIRDYCDKSNDESYKDGGQMIWFIVCAVIFAIVLMLSIDHLESNYNYWFVPESERSHNTVYNDDGSVEERIETCYNVIWSWRENCNFETKITPTPTNWIPLDTDVSKTLTIHGKKYFIEGQVYRGNTYERVMDVDFVVHSNGLVSKSESKFCPENQVRLIDENRCIPDEHWKWNGIFLDLVEIKQIDPEDIDADLILQNSNEKEVTWYTKIIKENPEQVKFETRKELALNEKTINADRIDYITGFYRDIKSHPSEFVDNSITCDEFQTLYNHAGNLWSDVHDSKPSVMDKFQQMRPDCKIDTWSN